MFVRAAAVGLALATLVVALAAGWTAWQLVGFEPPPGAELHAVGDTALQVIDEGSGDPPIVLIHGGGGSIDDFGALRERLRRDRRVLTVERPGNGWSAPYPSVPTDYLATNAALIRALLDERGVERPALLGWSYGGAVVLRMAADDPAYPSAIVHLSGMAPGFDPLRSSVAAPFRAAAWIDLPGVVWVVDRALRPGVVGLIPDATSMELQFGTRWRDVPEATRARTWLGMLRPKRSALRETRQVVEDLARLEPALPGLPLPALVLTGSEDTVVPPAVGRALAGALSSARYVDFPGAGHAHHIVAPDEVAAELRAFLTSAVGLTRVVGSE